MKRILLICAIIAAALTACNKTENTETQTAEMKTGAWEYMVLKVTDRDIANQTAALNQLNAEGWELVTTHSQIGTSIAKKNTYSEYINVQTTALHYVLKRPRGTYPTAE
jgi:hypothetical protein